MPVITDIRTERVKRRRERVIYLDGTPTLAVTEETFLRSGLVTGQTLDTAQVQDIETSDGVIRAREQALRFLNHRLRTRREIEQRLTRNGWNAMIISRVVERLTQAGWIDDARFARLWVEERQRLRPAGLSLLRRELRHKGVDAALIDAALQDHRAEDDEPTRAYALLEQRKRRYAGLAPEAAGRRMAGLLSRRGFDGETIYAVVHRMLNDMKEQES